MTTLSNGSDLEALGDELSRATARDLRRGARRPTGRVAIAVMGLLVFGAGTAAAAALLSPRQVAEGMPAGGVIFDQTHPSCTANRDGSYACTLSSVPAPEVSDFTGTKEVLVVDGKAAGGCLGLDAAGMTWTCYVGQDAVDHEIISQDFLGQPAGPGRG